MEATEIELLQEKPPFWYYNNVGLAEAGERLRNADPKDIVALRTYRWDRKCPFIAAYEPSGDAATDGALSQVDFQASLKYSGSLGRLPPELLAEVCSKIDIKSLFALGQANRRMREFVKSWKDYQTVSRHIPGVVRVLLQTDIVSWFTVGQLLKVLYENKCVGCGMSAGSVFLPTMERACHCCLEHNFRFTLVSTTSVLHQLGTPPWLKSHVELPIPSFTSIAGFYGPRFTTWKKKKQLVLAVTAHEAFPECADLFGSKGSQYGFVAATEVPWLHPDTLELERGYHCGACDKGLKSEKDMPAHKHLDSLDPRMRAKLHHEYLSRFKNTLSLSPNNNTDHDTWDDDDSDWEDDDGDSSNGEDADDLEEDDIVYD